MATPHAFQDDANYHKQSYLQFNFPARSSKVRAVPESPTLLMSPGIRRVESSPPVVMGTPSPPFPPNNATLRVRKRRTEHTLAYHDATEQNDSQYISKSSHRDDKMTTGLDNYWTEMQSSGLYQVGKSTGIARSNGAAAPEKENMPVYFRELTDQDFPLGLQRRESGKRKALVKMLDGAKSKYPRLSQRSFTTAGLIRRSSTKSVRLEDQNAGIWSTKQVPLTLGRQTQSLFDPLIGTDRARRDVSKSADFRQTNKDQAILAYPRADYHSQAPLQPSRQDVSTAPPAHPAPPALLSMQLRVLAETSVLRADDEGSFWIAIEAEAILRRPDGAYDPAPTDITPYGELCDVLIAIEACQGCKIETIIGSVTETSIRAHETMLLMVKVQVDQYEPTVHEQGSATLEQQKSELDVAFTELEALLGETLTPLLSINCQYRHTLLPEHSEISTQETCFLKRITCGSLWGVPPEDDEYRCPPHMNVLHQKLVFALATELPAAQAIRELTDTFCSSRVCACPEYLEMARCSLRKQLSSHGDDAGVDKEDVLALLSPPQPRLPRFSNEMQDKPLRALAEPFTRHPTHVILPLGGLKSTRTAAHHSGDDGVDHAQEIWRHIRNKSKGDETPLRGRTEALRDLQNLDKPLWEIRKLALQNKRSVGADTLKSLAASTRGFGDGTHAPWL